ncbi:hypothetical protein ACVWXR_000739 [Pseudomonas lurida]
MGDALVQQFEVALLGGLQCLGVWAVLQHHDQLVTQALAQLEPQVQGDEVAANQGFLGLGHLHDAHQAQDQAQQGDGDQC